METLVRICILIVITSFLSCDQLIDPIPAKKELIFGFFSGECVGDNCVVYFKVNKHELRKDVLKDYNGKKFLFSQKLDDKLKPVAEFLIDKVPQILLDNPNTIVGCPDCRDGGALHVELIENGKRSFWRIDPDLSQIDDAELKKFIPLLEERIFFILDNG